MKILAVDDERLALDALTDAILKAYPKAEVYAYTTIHEALAFAEENQCNIAFLDVRLRGISGLDLALRLKKYWPNVNVIFVTGYDEYALLAIQQRCSGYLLKPVKADEVKRELENLRYPIQPIRSRIHAHTFGNFELFVDSKAVPFATSRSKELLAYLIDRRGAMVSNASIAAAIWEDNDNITSVQAQLRKAKAALIDTLKAEGISEILISTHKDMAVDTSKMSCDYWQLLNNDVSVLNSFTGEYMSGYSWAFNTITGTENQ